MHINAFIALSRVVKSMRTCTGA